MTLRRLSALLLALGLGLACGRAAGPRTPPPARIPASTEAAPKATGAVPAQALRVLAYVEAHGEAPPGTEGGRTFGNYERRLPLQDAQGHPLRYREWDLWPKVRGRNRGPERLVTGSDGRAWYTGDHYRTFTEVRHADR